MQAFKTLEAVVAPLDRANVDTDAIIPKQFLKSIKRTGFGAYLFDEWRFLDAGSLDKQPDDRQLNPDFILNQACYSDAEILITKKNFGCGSSREHAPWALADYGFKVIIAPSFADIFYNNCFKNGVLVIQLSEQKVDELIEHCLANPGCAWKVDLEQQQIELDNGELLEFDIEAARREHLLQGLDDIGLTLQHEQLIKDYETKRRQSKPWLYDAIKP